MAGLAGSSRALLAFAWLSWAGLAWPSGGDCCFSHLSFVGGAVGVLGAAVSSLSSC